MEGNCNLAYQGQSYKMEAGVETEGVKDAVRRMDEMEWGIGRGGWGMSSFFCFLFIGGRRWFYMLCCLLAQDRDICEPLEK